MELIRFATEGHTEADYYALPDDRRVELIDGTFYDMASPNVRHQTVLFDLASVIRDHINSEGCDCKVFIAPLDVKLYAGDEDTIVQPDIMVVCDPDKIKENRIDGAPDWVIEILSPGNRGHDLYTKQYLYERAGVKEYWIVDIQRKKVIKIMFDDTSIELYTLGDKVDVGICGGFSIDFKEIIDTE